MTYSNEELIRLIDRAVDEYQGPLDVLESAIGLLLVGRQYGWRVMLLVHSPSTIRKYMKILGIRHLREVLPEVGVFAHRSRAWRLVEGTQSFWKAVRGQLGGVRSTEVDGPKGRPDSSS